MDRAAIETHRVAAKTALLVYLGFTFYLPFPLWLGVASWKALGALALCILTCAVLTQRLIHHPPPPGRLPLLHVAVSSLTMGVASVMLGAFIIVPTIAMANVVAYVASTERRGRVWVVLASCLAVALPALGAFAGVLPETYTFEGGVMQVHPWMMNFPEIPTWIFLIVANVALVASGGYFVGRLRDDLLTAQRTLHLQAWQLEQIAPEDAQPMLSLRGSAQP